MTGSARGMGLLSRTVFEGASRHPPIQRHVPSSCAARVAPHSESSVIRGVQSFHFEDEDFRAVLYASPIRVRFGRVGLDTEVTVELLPILEAIRVRRIGRISGVCG